MKKGILICLIFSTITFIGMAQNKKTAKPKPKITKTEKRIDAYEMKTYYMVFLKRGPERNQDSATTAKIMEGHLAHLTRMNQSGKMDLAGPFLDDGEIRGICVYNVASLEEAKQLAEEDPAVKAGRLVIEIHPWMSAKGFGLR